MRSSGEAMAIVGGRVFFDLADVTSDLSALDSSGTWVTLFPYDGEPVLARFNRSIKASLALETPTVVGGPFESNMTRFEFEYKVLEIQEQIREGNVYQVNLCRILSAPLVTDNLHDLAIRTMKSHRDKQNLFLQLPKHGISVVCASPETFLVRKGAYLYSEPIKGTRPLDGTYDKEGKDHAENVMIVDLVRNDLGRICDFGTVDAPRLCDDVPTHGLSHLVSGVDGFIGPEKTWADIYGALFPPGSVTGAPKEAACAQIELLETASRGPYCGALGMVDADQQKANLALTIRTFWRDEDKLRFGAGAGITIGSDPTSEWFETELKARRLIEIAGNVCTPERTPLRRDGNTAISV